MSSFHCKLFIVNELNDFLLYINAIFIFRQLQQNGLSVGVDASIEVDSAKQAFYTIKSKETSIIHLDLLLYS